MVGGGWTDATHCIRSALAPSSPLLLMMAMMDLTRLMPRGRFNACGSSSLECCIHPGLCHGR